MSILDNVIDEHVRRTCHCQEAADSTRDVIAKEIAGIRREAAVKALREAADAALAVREAHCKVWPCPGILEWPEAAHEYELTREAFEQLRESPWGWIMDRADKLEGENK